MLRDDSCLCTQGTFLAGYGVPGSAAWKGSTLPVGLSLCIFKASPKALSLSVKQNVLDAQEAELAVKAQCTADSFRLCQPHGSCDRLYARHLLYRALMSLGHLPTGSHIPFIQAL